MTWVLLLDQVGKLRHKEDGQFPEPAAGKLRWESNS